MFSEGEVKVQSRYISDAWNNLNLDGFRLIFETSVREPCFKREFSDLDWLSNNVTESLGKCQNRSDTDSITIKTTGEHLGKLNFIWTFFENGELLATVDSRN